MTSNFQPSKLVVKTATQFLDKYRREDLPAWVSQFDGPFNRHNGLELTMQEVLSEALPLLWQRWAQQMLPNGLGTMVVPQIFYSKENPQQALPKPVMKFILFIAKPNEVLRFGRSHVSKDRELSLVAAKHVVNISDVEEWQHQRRHLAEAFLPLGPLTQFVDTLRIMSDAWYLIVAFRCVVR